jgi:hypothetical protein
MLVGRVVGFQVGKVFCGWSWGVLRGVARGDW